MADDECPGGEVAEGGGETGTGSALRTIGWGALLVSGGEALYNLLLWLSGVVMIGRYWGAEILGSFGMTMVVSRMSDVLGRAGLPVTNIRFLPEFWAHGNLKAVRSAAWFTTLVAAATGTAAGAALWFAAPLIAVGFYHRPDLTGAFRLAALMAPLTTVMLTALAVPQAAKDALPFVLVSRIGVPLCGLIGTGIAVWAHGGLATLLWVQVAALAIGSVASVLFMLRSLPKGPGTADAPVKWGRIARFSALMCLKGLSRFGLSVLDIILLGRFVNDRELGVYIAAQRISLFITFPRRAIAPIYMPTVAEQHARGDRARMEAVYATTRRWVTGLALVIFGVMVIAPREVMATGGHELALGGAALIVLCVSNLTESCLGGANEVLLMSGGQKVATITEWAGVVILAVTLPPLATKWGIMGACWSNLLAQGSVNIARQLWLSAHLKFHQFDRRFVWAALPSAALITVLALGGGWFGGGLVSAIIRVAIFAVLFSIILIAGWLPELRVGGRLRLPSRNLLSSGALEATEPGPGSAAEQDP
jgi:O-antigen/teichoic acid export membrane protein